MEQPHRCHGCLSRRECLKYVSAAALSLTLGNEAHAAPKQNTVPVRDYVDPARLRPHPTAKVEMAFLGQPRPYWLGWPGTTYDLDGHQAEYRKQAEQSCRRLGINLAVAPAMIRDESGFATLLKGAQTRNPDGLLVVLQHMNCWGWVDRLAREAGVPLLVFAPIGTSFTGHVAEISRRTGVHVISSLSWPAVEDGLRMIRAKLRFEETRLLWIQGNQRNETVLDRLGVRVRAIPRDNFNLQFDRQSATEEVRDVASAMRRGAKRVREPNEQDCINSARSYVTAKRLMAEEQANALSMDCLGMVGSKLVPTPPCFAWTMLQDAGVTAGCEADLFGALSLMLTSYLLDRPGYMNDPVAETEKNLLITSHCTSGTRIRGFDQPPAPYILRSHSESALGVSTQVIWPVGEPVTLVRFNSPDQLIVDSGRIVSNVDTPPAGGCRTSLEIRMDRMEDARDVQGFHQVVTLGTHRHIVEAFCQLYGIGVLHSPERSAHEEATA